MKLVSALGCPEEVRAIPDEGVTVPKLSDGEPVRIPIGSFETEFFLASSILTFHSCKGEEPWQFVQIYLSIYQGVVMGLWSTLINLTRVNQGKNAWFSSFC